MSEVLCAKIRQGKSKYKFKLKNIRRFNGKKKYPFGIDFVLSISIYIFDPR